MTKEQYFRRLIAELPHFCREYIKICAARGIVLGNNRAIGKTKTLLTIDKAMKFTQPDTGIDVWNYESAQHYDNTVRELATLIDKMEKEDNDDANDTRTN